MGKLDGKVAIVVGSGTPMGGTTAQLLAKEGARVVLADINIEGAEVYAAQIRSTGRDAFAFKIDISMESDVKAMVAETVKRYGGVDVLNNVAAALGPDVIVPDSATDAATLDLAVWDRAMAVNLRGHLLTIRHVIPEMLKRGGGSIINISSGASLLTEPCRGAYAVSKAGVNMLTKHIATMYGKRGIRCNAVAPGLILTRDLSPEFQDTYVRHTLIPRIGQPEDIARAVVFLASDDASFITGQVISVDGGLTTHMPYWADMVASSGYL